MRIADGRCQAYEGIVPAPSLTIHTPSEVCRQGRTERADGLPGGPGEDVLWIVPRYLLLVPTFVFTVWYRRWHPACGSFMAKGT
ncbi:MAG TPA: hypothetical protein VMW83_15345 [Spirochaetia bacterium]|nr:hypothetical protein [Spirochaetia bacterium]